MKAYGELQHTISSPPQSFTEPLDIDSVKAYLRVSDDSEDDILSEMIGAARATAELYQGLDLIQKQWDLHLDLLIGNDAINAASHPSHFGTIYNFGVDDGIDLRYPLQSVDLFQTTDVNGSVTTLTEGIGADYRLDKNRGRVLPPWGKIWPWYTPDVSSSVLIRFTSGYPETHPFWQNNGRFVKQGMMLLVSGWYENRLPYDAQLRGSVDEYPFSVTSLLNFGARPRVY